MVSMISRLVNVFLFLGLVQRRECQILSQWMDTFQRDLCRERWHQMDWQSLIRPCKNNLEYGQNVWSDKLRTSPKWSHILKMDIRKTGEFSKIAIQSRTNEGRIKDIGGDTWRIFVRGPEFLTPYVTDLGNGAYQASFLITKPGFYKAEVILESTLCDGFKDPPLEWLKKDPENLGIASTRKIWQPLRGGLVAFKVEPSDPKYLKEVKKSMGRFKDLCGKQYQCGLLWKGFGRWVNGTWHSYLEENEDEEEAGNNRCKRDKIGTLKIHGDCFTHHFTDNFTNGTLCKRTFKKCDRTSDWLYPGTKFCIDDELNNKPVLNAREMSLKRALKYLKNVLRRNEMDERSALLLNYGSQFIESLTFAAYKKLIDRVVRSLRRYKGQAVYRTTPSTWKPADKPLDAFNNYQRTMLFNAYATSAMCQAGLPVVDIFQQSVSNPKQEDTRFKYNKIYPLMDNVLASYFEGRAIKGCEPTKKSFIEKIRQLDPGRSSIVHEANATIGAEQEHLLNSTEINNESSGYASEMLQDPGSSQQAEDVNGDSEVQNGNQTESQSLTSSTNRKQNIINVKVGPDEPQESELLDANAK